MNFFEIHNKHSISFSFPQKLTLFRDPIVPNSANNESKEFGVVASCISFKITLSYFSLIPLLRLSKSVVQQCVGFCITFNSVYQQYKSHRFLTDGFVLCQPKSYAAYTFILLVYKKQKETVFLPSPIALFQCQIEKAVLV